MSASDSKSTQNSSWRFRGSSDGRNTELSGDGEFDELFVASWLHIERMDENYYWMQVGDLKIELHIDGGKIKGWTSTFER